MHDEHELHACLIYSQFRDAENVPQYVPVQNKNMNDTCIKYYFCLKENTPLEIYRDFHSLISNRTVHHADTLITIAQDRLFNINARNKLML